MPSGSVGLQSHSGSLLAGGGWLQSESLLESGSLRSDWLAVASLGAPVFLAARLDGLTCFAVTPSTYRCPRPCEISSWPAGLMWQANTLNERRTLLRS